MLNTVVLSLEWLDMDPGFVALLDKINLSFTVIFIFEAAIKLIAFKSAYFKDGWNIFDFAIVLGSIITFALTQWTSFEFSSNPTVVRTFRIGRVLRLVKRAESL